jgi:hypothetical protein
MSEKGRDFSRDIDQPFSFRRKPIPVPAEARPPWKLAELLVMLQVSSRGGKSSLKRLHLLNWAVRSSANRLRFKESRKAVLPLFRFNVRFEPAFSRAIDLATGAKLVEWIGGDRIQLSAEGSDLAQRLLKEPGVLQQERDFFLELGKSVTEKEAEYVLGIRSGL